MNEETEFVTKTWMIGLLIGAFILSIAMLGFYLDWSIETILGIFVIAGIGFLIQLAKVAQNYMEWRNTGSGGFEPPTNRLRACRST